MRLFSPPDRVPNFSPRDLMINSLSSLLVLLLMGAPCAKAACSSGRSVQLYSAGFFVGNSAQITIDGTAVFPKETSPHQNRGYNVVVLDGTTLQIKSQRTFDVYGFAYEASLFVSFLNTSINYHDAIIVAVNDDATGIGDTNTYTALAQEFGAKEITSYAFRESYLLVSYKGAPYPLLEAKTVSNHTGPLNNTTCVSTYGAVYSPSSIVPSLAPSQGFSPSPSKVFSPSPSQGFSPSPSQGFSVSPSVATSIGSPSTSPSSTPVASGSPSPSPGLVSTPVPTQPATVEFTFAPTQSSSGATYQTVTLLMEGSNINITALADSGFGHAMKTFWVQTLDAVTITEDEVTLSALQTAEQYSNSHRMLQTTTKVYATFDFFIGASEQSKAYAQLKALSTDVLTADVNTFLSKEQSTSAAVFVESYPSFSQVSIVGITDYENGQPVSGSSKVLWSTTVTGISVIVLSISVGCCIFMLLGMMSWKCFIDSQPSDKDTIKSDRNEEDENEDTKMESGQADAAVFSNIRSSQPETTQVLATIPEEMEVPKDVEEPTVPTVESAHEEPNEPNSSPDLQAESTNEVSATNTLAPDEAGHHYESLARGASSDPDADAAEVMSVASIDTHSTQTAPEPDIQMLPDNDRRRSLMQRFASLWSNQSTMG